MKVFLSFLQSKINHPLPAYSFWEHYIKNGILEAGYEWTECPDADWALGLVPQSKNDHLKWKQDIWEKTVKHLKKYPVDIFLSYLYPEQIDKTAIKEIQRIGIPCVNLFCDNVRNFKSIPSEFGVFNLNWVPEYQAIKQYNKAGYPNINLPMPMWVEPQYRAFKEEANQQITFIGSKDIQRKILFENVVNLASNISLAIYGSGWKKDDQHIKQQPVSGYDFNKKIIFNLNFITRYGIIAFMRKLNQQHIKLSVSSVLDSKTHKSLTFKEYNTITAESMITLGVNRYPSFRFPLSQPDCYSRLRDIEAPMLGACYLTEYTSGIDELYDIGKEIMIYRNADELICKLKELQGDFNLRKKLKINGQKRALQDHSIPNSLNKIIQNVIH